MDNKLFTCSIMTLQTFLVRVHLVIFSVLVCGSCQQSSVQKYDFIVVGSGAGGSAVARRLVETGRFKVLLVEAGGSPKTDYDVPAIAIDFIADPETTFHFETTQQEHVGQQTNGVMSIFAGRMLGGSTSLNAMWFNRGHPRDWDNWAKVTGDDSWKYEKMLKYFKRSETYVGDFPSDQHGNDGPITVSRQKYAPGLDYFLEAGRELGHYVGDPNGPQQRGFTTVEFSKRNGRRVSSFEGYITPVLDNPNLQVLTYTHVDKILFEGNRAVGVHFMPNATNKSEQNNVAYATREIIISAGTYNSPLILQRSGIGPRKLLQSANIPLIKDLPTGLNFHDHSAVNLHFIINNASAVFDEEKDLTDESWKSFTNLGDGPYSINRGATGQALISSSVAAREGNADWPDVQLCMSHSTVPYVLGTGALDQEARTNMNMTEGEVPMSCAVFVGRPKSTGSVSINPRNVTGNPIIDPGYLNDPRDLQMFLDGIQETIRIYEHTDSYRRLGARYAPATLPDCQGFPVKSREYWICYIRQAMVGGCHPAGTNKMGRRDDPSAVVDSELRVIGIEGLRVVDASVMPYITNANPQAAIYAIAEKAAELILNKLSPSSPVSSSSFKHYVIENTSKQISVDRPRPLRRRGDQHLKFKSYIHG